MIAKNLSRYPLLAAVSAIGFFGNAQAATPVFINEIHYDNDDADKRLMRNRVCMDIFLLIWKLFGRQLSEIYLSLGLKFKTFFQENSICLEYQEAG